MTPEHLIIAALAVSAPNWVAQATGASEARSLITGEESKADTFAQSVYAWLEVVASAELADDSISVERLDAHFAVYGQLPVVLIKLPDAFVLIDAVNGNVAGPYDLTSDMDARPLLSVHNAAWVIAGAKFFGRNGCNYMAAPGWKDTPPGGGPQWPLTPAVAPATPEGGGAPYNCRPVGQGGCVCTRPDTRTVPPGTTPVPTQTRCDYTPAGCDPGAGCTGPYNPQYPSGNPPGPPQGCNVNCKPQYWY